MMTKTFTALSIGVGMVAGVLGCSAPASHDDDIGSIQQLARDGRRSSSSSSTTSSSSSSGASQCENTGGVNGVLAALAVAAANEMHRWLPGRDFEWSDDTGMLQLSKWARPRCPNRQCLNSQALLDLQKPEADGTLIFDGNVRLDGNLLRSRLRAYWDAQLECNLAGNCPVDYHDLVYHHVEAGPCGDRYFYDAFEQGTSTPIDAAQASLFSNQLLFLGHPDNPFLAFAVEEDRASVDPTYGLTESATSSSGSCSAACAKYSASDLSGHCCSCGRNNGRYVTSAFSSFIYLCR